MANLYLVHDWEEINVSASVGRNGVNAKDDVLAVQALMKFGLEEREFFKGDKFPQPTGTMCKDTMRLIEKFQRYLRKLCDSKISIDGRIDPAKGLVAFGRSGRWTIQMLNGEAHSMWVLCNQPGQNYIQSLCMKFPALRPAIGGEVPVGTLNLSLESSPRLVGSLNMALE